MEYVHCSPKQKMVLKSADYGDFNKNGAFNDDENFDTTCSKLTNCQVKSRCGGNRSCELTMDNNLLPSEYCSDTLKEIYTKYTCVDTYSSSTITKVIIIYNFDHIIKTVSKALRDYRYCKLNMPNRLDCACLLHFCADGLAFHVCLC